MADGTTFSAATLLIVHLFEGGLRDCQASQDERNVGDKDSAHYINLLPVGHQRYIQHVSNLYNSMYGFLWHLLCSVSSGHSQVEIALAIPQLPYLLSLHDAFLPAFGGIEVEPHPLGCLRPDIEHLLELLRVTGKEYKIIGLGREQFYGQVENDGAEQAALLDSSLDWDVSCLTLCKMDDGGTAIVELPDEVDGPVWYNRFLAGLHRAEGTGDVQLYQYTLSSFPPGIVQCHLGCDVALIAPYT